MLFYNCAQDVAVKEDKGQENNVTTYSVVATVDFTLPPGCRWNYTLPKGKSSGISIIHSREELVGNLSCGETLSPVDFEKYSLLLAYGDTTSNVHTLTYQFVQVAENEFRLDVDIQLGTDAWPEGWTIAVLTPKIPQNTTIRLNEVQNQGNPGEFENPFRDNITGTWKLLYSITGEDTLDCSGNHIIYDFQTESKLVVTSDMSGDLLEGEYAYEYKKINVCSTCPSVPNMRIDDENGLFCEACSEDKKMIISGKRAEDGTTLNRSKIFVLVDRNKSDENPNNIEIYKWKLVGFVNGADGTIKTPEPVSENSYWIIFNDNGTLFAKSAVNELVGKYKINFSTSTISITELGGTKIGEPLDGKLFVEGLQSIRSFVVEKASLRLYHNEADFLLFNRIQP
jgi:hypothetical protein